MMTISDYAFLAYDCSKVRDYSLQDLNYQHCVAALCPKYFWKKLYNCV